MKVVFAKGIFHLPMQVVVAAYNIIVMILGVLFSVFCFLEKELWKKITLLLAIIILLPYVSSSYKMIFMFIPLWLFVNKDTKSKFDMAHTILFGLLLVPYHLIIITPTNSNPHGVLSATPLVLPSLLLVMAFLIIYENIREKINAKT